MNRKILVVAAHPDDEKLGCGGTMAVHSRTGDEVYVLILGEGVTSRDEKRDKEKRGKEINNLRMNIEAANRIVGTRKSFVFDFPDNRFDSVSLLDIIKVVEKVKNEVRPDIIYTHHQGDLNIDHQIAYRAVLTACRPLKGETITDIYSFEVPSSTEWNVGFCSTFVPNYFVDISGSLEIKKKAVRA
ncbi:MAG TPA: PIG-L family deacetylase, partial [Thermodesulfovibrionales bacterium]|nr:PIG-L family deacetylase [Thermodesulfovibrionales bacterium]